MSLSNSAGKRSYVLPENPTEEEIKKYHSLQCRKQWRDRNRDKIHQNNVSEKNKEYKKQYRLANKDKVRESSSKWYSENKDYFKQRIVCEICGKDYIRSGLTSHRKTQVHQQALVKNEENEN